MNSKRKFYTSVITLGVLATVWHWVLPQYALAASLNYWHAATSSESLVFKIEEKSVDSIRITVSDEVRDFTVKVVEAPEVKEVKPELALTPKEEMRAWVLAEAKKAGLNPKEVDAIIHCESRWDDQAVGHNRNGSNDKGLWQINSIHKLPDSERLDYKSATKWAIEKRLRDGNWSAWYCARRLAIK